MTKYYRVRTPEQWDWLNNKLKKQGKRYNSLSSSEGCVQKRLDNDSIGIAISEDDFAWDYVNYIARAHDVPTKDFIEVSQMMEDEKMEDYVTIYNDDLDKITDELGIGAFERITNSDHWAMVTADIKQLNILKSLVQQHEEIDAYQEVAKNYPLSADDVRDILYHHVFSGSTPKIKMTEAEKVEFDELDRDIYTTLTGTLKYIEEKLENSLLHKRLFHNNDFRLDNKAQIEFARAWEDPSLIEVIKKPKYNVKVPNTKDCLYYKINNSVRAGVPQRRPSRFKFTASELKQHGLDSDMYEKVEVQE